MKKAQNNAVKQDKAVKAHQVDMLSLFESEDSNWFGAGAKDHFTQDEAWEILSEMNSSSAY